jgi:ADP-heptose:LPS heptosyltransferase
MWLSYLRHSLALRAWRYRYGKKIIAIGLVEHFGDIVACEPVPRYLKRKNPESLVIWFANPRYMELLTHNPYVDRVQSVYCLSEWIRFRRSGIFDEVIDLHFHQRACPVCQESLRKDSQNAEITIHNYYNYGNLLGAFCQSAGLPILAEGPQLHIPERVRRIVDAMRLSDEYIVVHCRSNEAARDWMQEKWVQLVKQILSEARITVVEIGLVRTLPDMGEKCVNLCGILTFLETAEVIRRSKLFLGIDSGPAHLANAVGTRGIIMLGRYKSFEKYCPFSGTYANGANAELIYSSGPVQELPVEIVFGALSRSLQCPASEKNGKGVVYQPPLIRS